MIHAANLKIESLRYQDLKSRLQAEFGAVDAETITDTLEGITDLHAMIAAVVRSALVDEALQAGLRLRLEEMKERLSRLELRSTKKRQLALDVMSEVGLAKLEQPDFTASTRAGTPALIVVEEESIPTPYWVPQPPKLDRQALLRELKQGGHVAGTQLSNPKLVLTVRTK